MFRHRVSFVSAVFGQNSGSELVRFRRVLPGLISNASGPMGMYFCRCAGEGEVILAKQREEMGKDDRVSSGWEHDYAMYVPRPFGLGEPSWRRKSLEL